MTFLLVATFKSNKTTPEVESWLADVAPASRSSSARIVCAPSFVHLPAAQAKISSLQSNILLSAQDVSPFPPGSYTGAVNATQLLDLGVKYCLVGHSERRTYFHETHTEIANKITLLLEHSLTPILCLRAEDISGQFATLQDKDLDKIIFCYEPPGEIGGTETASPEEIKHILAQIQAQSDHHLHLMYGGSVNANNIESLLSLGLTGTLVSTASLESSSFIDIISRLNALEE